MFITSQVLRHGGARLAQSVGAWTSPSHPPVWSRCSPRCLAAIKEQQRKESGNNSLSTAQQRRSGSSASRAVPGGGRRGASALSGRAEAWLTNAALQQPPVLIELLKLGRLALPLLLQYVIANSSTLVNTSFVGHQDDPALLSCMALGASLSMATGYNVLSGVASASETLAGQAAGAHNYPALHATLLRALAVVGAACIPITLAWTHSEWLLTHLLGQPHDIAAGAARYLQLTLPALYMYGIHECVDKYLLAQRVVKPSLVITTVSTALTPLLAWWLIVDRGMGLDGAAWTYVAVQACTTGMGLAYLGYREAVQLPRRQPEGWVPMRPSLPALAPAAIAPYLALALPAVLSHSMEGTATEALVFLSGLLDNADVAVGVSGLVLQFSALVWMAAASIGSATSTRVANKLGRGDAAGARRTAYTAIVTVAATQGAVGLAALAHGDQLLGLMTRHPDTISLALQVMPVLAVCFVADGLNVVQGSVLAGAGRQWWTAGLNLAGWWGIGVPLAAYLALGQGQGVVGLWAGFTGASLLTAGLHLFAVTQLLDWDEEVKRAKAMMGSQPTPTESSDDDDLGVGGNHRAEGFWGSKGGEEPRRRLVRAGAGAGGVGSATAPADGGGADARG